MGERTITIGRRAVDIWPRATRVSPINAHILVAAFGDGDVVNPGLRRYILERAARGDDVASPTSRLFGGIKIYHLHEWGVPEAELMHARALSLFRRATGGAARAELSWANVYRTGDCSAPHGHGRTAASVVYMLDLGDAESEEPFCGRFSFADPRLDLCCREEPGVMTSPFFPALEVGHMIMFPGEIVHFVTPYFGDRPRITLAWNLNACPGADGGAPEN